ncbi:RNA-directed DNA polymerase, eukaryota [Tanacetum coccineum]
MNMVSLNVQGLNPKAKKDWVKEICVSHKVNFLTLQETKMEDISLIDVKCCWGNYAFDGVNLLIISVYAPQEYAEKKMLWDYLVHVISKWDGEVIVMGDFNEVRFKNERFGSLFHAHGADAFNRFILQANLQEIPVGGCSFTWCHRSAKKMSKLDRIESLKDIHEAEKVDNLEAAQQAKIKNWAIEGVEEHKFYQWILNRTRNQLGIRGILKVILVLIEKDVVAAVQHFFTSGNFPKGCNASFIALIPKIPDAKLVKDFRPISLIGSLYKIIAKILANRLVGVLGDLVSEVQSAFVADRQILDGPLILNEVLQWCKAKKKQTFIFKIDFEKAYDSVRWDFLGDVLNRFGFGAKWCGWIQECLRSSRGSVLVNGSTTEEFQFYKGLKQGDPLSPFLFILVMESLHLSFKRVEDAASKNHGGLGISSFFALNRALLLKWIWRFISSDGSLWSKVIQALYGKRIDFHATKFSSIWCSIIRELHQLKDNGFDFWEHCKIRIGNGSTTRFWYDLWIGDMPLYAKFPRLFALDLNKDCSVADKLNNSVELSFRRAVRGGIEQHQMSDLVSMLESIVLSSSNDRWVCGLSNDGDFKVKDIRIFLDDLFLPHSEPTRWIKAMPIKINIFAWRARKDCLPTRMNLVQRDINIDSVLCPVCVTNDEDAHHLFFRCDLAQHVLRRLCRWWDLDTYGWSSFHDWLSWFSTIRFPSKSKSLLEGQDTTPAEMLKGLDKQFQRKEDGGLYLAERI